MATINEWLETNLQRDIWNKKYRHYNETFKEWLERVSAGDEELKQLMLEKKFLFGGRILANRGLHKIGRKITYSNCYVSTPPEDSIESIFDVAKKLARTYSYGGGIGVDISKLRPRNAKVNNAAKHTTGSVSFMDLYSLTTELIGMEGRRGALMISIDCNHPDIEEFIDIKNDLNKVTKANISIKITDEFMKAVVNDENYDLCFKVEATGEEIKKKVRAKDIFRKMAESNWRVAEPGTLYWSRINDWNLLSEDENFEYAGTNPCAEEPLPAGGSCLLGSINLSEFILNPFTEDSKFDFESFSNAIKKITTSMNEVLDEGLPLHPLQEQRESVRDWRQIGIGIMGLSDMLIKLGLEYGEKESVKLCNRIAFIMIDNAICQSALLAKDLGVYPKYNSEAVLKSPFFIANTTEQTKSIVSKYGLRNSQLLTIAPTGSISTMLGISGGIEPIFNISYTRKTESLHGEEKYYKVYTPIVEKYMSINKIKEESDLPEFFVTAMTLDYNKRIDMQSVWQKHIDASISSTVNVPEEFTVEEVEDLYIKAWEKGLKGITIYRDNCFRTGILTNDNKDTKEHKQSIQHILEWGTVLEPSDDMVGKKRKLTTGCGTLHCQAFFDPITGDFQEVYLAKGSTGGCNNFMVGLSRMISQNARTGADIYTIVDQLNSTGACPSYVTRKATKGDTSKGSCCPMAVGKALLEMQLEMWDELGIKEKEEPKQIVVKKVDYKKDEGTQKVVKSICPECGEEIEFSGGCNFCPNCGWSQCS